MTAPGSYDRIILHIGRHKTGTSYLQRTLYNSEAVLAAAGVNYPGVGRSGVAHHPLATTLLPKNPADAAARERADVLASELVAELAVARGSWLFSSEGLSNVRDPGRLETFFDPGRTDVIVYLREQYRLAQSAYAQMIQSTRATQTFERYLDRVTFDQSALLSRWSDRFAPRRLIVRGYARESLIDGDIVADFVASAELPRVELVRRAREQRPLAGGPLLEFKRILNFIPDLPPDFDRLTFRNFSVMAENEPDFRVKPAVPLAQVAAYRVRYAEENSALISAHPQLREALAAAPVEEIAEMPRRSGFRRVWRAIAQQHPKMFKMLAEAVGAERPGEPPELGLLRRLRP